MGFLRKKVSTSIYYRRLFRRHRAELDQLKQILGDEQSIKTVDLLLKARTAILRRPEYYFMNAAAGVCDQFHFVDENGYRVSGPRNPYFLPEFFHLDRDMVLFDGGAYIGDSIEQLFSLLGGSCKKVYAFEPNPVTFQTLQARTEQFKSVVQCYPYGLDKCERLVSFHASDAGSRIAGDGELTIATISTGSFLKQLSTDHPSFIKLDVEGKEQDVLESAAKYIRSRQPDMAVSIYHRLEDLWTIPLLLHQICPEYRLYVRHQSNYYTETICYVTIRRS